MLIALSVLCLAVGLVGFLRLVVTRAPGDAADSFERILHQFEEDDVLRGEVERRRREGKS